MARREIDASDLLAKATESTGPQRSGTAFLRTEVTGVAEFNAEAIGIYHPQFWLFFKLVAQAVAIGWFAIVTGRHESREIGRHIPRGIEGARHPVELIEMTVANFAGSFGS